MIERPPGLEVQSGHGFQARVRSLRARHSRRISGCITLFALLVTLTACTSLPQNYTRETSYALGADNRTRAGEFFRKEIESHPGQSGFHLLASGESAFRARNIMARIAEKTLDAQYFIWESDTTGGILAYQLLEAAERGVRVRLLLDDINIDGRDIGIASLDLHPNIEVRLFNPFEDRGSMVLEFVTNMDRLNHRMHNKAFIMDNAFAVAGGRNIGDHYFGISDMVNFRDLDIFATGPIVQDISRSFDVFWNSRWAVPVSAVIDEAPSSAEAARRRKRLESWVQEKQPSFPYRIDHTRKEFYDALAEVRHKLIWADAELIYDDPEKKVGTDTGYQGIKPRMNAMKGQVKEEILVEAAYYIPRESMVSGAAELSKKGIRLRLLTNSMATNDGAAAFSGYSSHREDLIRNGVELYELRPDLGTQRKFWSLLAGKSTATLHTKTAVVDRKVTIIGSYNSDPRSADINTEMVLVIESPELAEKVIEFMDVGVDPSNSYHLVLENETGDGDDDGELTWVSVENGNEVREDSDPKSGFWRPVSAWFMSLLPIDDHL